jgi:Na+-translocating ferredoxin:NAD+ oxidoreductase RnfD subunit
MTVGGFTHYPDASTLLALRERLEAARADVESLLDELITAMMLSGCEPEQMMVVCRLLALVLGRARTRFR